jgi:hypothetical protein
MLERSHLRRRRMFNRLRPILGWQPFLKVPDELFAKGTVGPLYCAGVRSACLPPVPAVRTRAHHGRIAPLCTGHRVRGVPACA